MATIIRNLSTITDADGNAEILLRLTVSREFRARLKSGIYINSKRFKNGAFVIPRADQEEAKKIREIESRLIDLERFLFSLCESTSKEQQNKTYFEEQLEIYKHPPVVEEPKVKEVKFFEVFDQFLASRNLSEWRVKHYNVLIRALMRFELYKRVTGQKRYKVGSKN